jgi:hypothetical protein
MSTLVHNHENCKITNNKMKIDWSPNGTISVSLNDFDNYYMKQGVPNADGKIYIQSHWGSGVRIYDVKITSK